MCLFCMHGCIEKLDKHSGIARGLAGAMAPPMACKSLLKIRFWSKILDKLALLAPLNDEKKSIPDYATG
jgi:hypothetical protein